MNNRWLVGLTVAFCTGFVAGVLVVAMPGRTRPAAIVITPAAMPAATATVGPTATPGLLHVFVSGEVVAPSVYELSPGSLIWDAVEAAGGFTAEAEREAVNLAQPAVDGVHVHIPAVGEAAEIPLVSEPMPLATAELPEVNSVALPAGGVVNVNVATAAELELLPGIGPALADAIIEYRTSNGPFATVEELMDVPGIGPAKLEGMRELVTVE
jgi:competence protein ComEA